MMQPAPSPAPELPAVEPPCPECTTAMRPVGGGRHPYWTCGFCGIAMPRW